MTPEERKAILDEARAAQRAAQKTGEAPLPDEDVRAIIRENAPRPDGVLDAVGDQLRVTTSSVMDPVRAGVGVVTNDRSFLDNLALERAKTNKAREAVEAISPGAASMGKIAGDTAMLAGLTPQAALASPMRAMATGAGIGMGAETLGSLEDTGELPTMEEELGAAALGAAGAGVGMILGSGANYLVNKALGKGTTIPKDLLKQIEKSERTVAASQAKLAAANVKIHQDAAARMLNRIEGRLVREGYSQKATPRTWQAVNSLRSRVAAGGEISLTELNNLRRQIRDFDVKKEPYGGVKTVTDEMNKFINGLAYAKSKNTVVSGDAKAGVSAWNAMNRNHIQAEKTNTLIQLTRAAENRAAGQGWEIERALQDEARKMVDDKTGRYLKAFSPEEKEILQGIAAGSGVGNWLNKLDAKLGHGIVRMTANTMTLPLRSVSNAAARNKMQLAVDGILHGSPVRQSLVSPLAGVATVGELVNQQNAQPTLPSPAPQQMGTPAPVPTAPNPAAAMAPPPPAPSGPAPKLAPMTSPQQAPGAPMPPSLGQQKQL